MIMNREDWLNKLKNLLEPEFNSNGYKYPEKIRLSCGFPARCRSAKRVLGQCWTTILSKDGTYEIFISPTIDDTTLVGCVLIHELSHSIVGIENKHNKLFKRCVVSMGLKPSITRVINGPKAISLINKLSKKIGLYPHATLSLPPAIQGTRLIKLTCPNCGYTVRTTNKWIEIGLARCPDGDEMQIDDGLDKILNDFIKMEVH